MKFLVIRFSSIGDIVLATPAIRCLKQQVENAEVHFLTKQSMKAVTEGNPYIDRFHYFNNNLDQLIKTLQEERFDYIIDLHKNFRTWRIKKTLKVPVLSYNKEVIEKVLLTRLHINKMAGRHVVERCIDALAPLGVQNDGKGMDYFIPSNVRVRAEDLPLSHSAGFVAIVIGASYYTKKLPVYKLRELCNKIQHPIVLVGGKEDKTEGEKITETDPMKIYNACGKFSLHESADIIRQSKLVISHDTGMQYIACALNKPVLAIWGGTSPALDVEPYYGVEQLQQHNQPAYHNFIVKGLPCQPCSNYGTKTCPRAHFKCMQDQDVDLIAKTAYQYL
ncbi:glycosyltransferase family 9 protein [Sediminibacterium sp.]|uniref:glycosyltransferase family 9 protein n=1 Tax=Sediminibacterium sp. TaxID=1917865 RepID=UPI0025CD75E3|nr:glycosyltransferase family 9 protein [Sediminibacterium sp.]MBW0178589.1 glycosyltransferase family 9 protein [Sediminibacterium sp.]